MWRFHTSVEKEPPTYNLENQAQKTDSGGIGGSGGILSTIMEGQGRQANDDDEEEDEKKHIMEHNNNTSLFIFYYGIKVNLSLRAF